MIYSPRNHPGCARLTPLAHSAVALPKTAKASDKSPFERLGKAW